MRYLLAVLAFLIIPSVALARADLQIQQSDVRFSKTPLIAGDQVRIYATVHNAGDEDVSGYVTFYQGATLVGSSQVISLLSGGSPEEVYVDFIVPSGAFNIQAQIEGTEPIDTQPENNVTITSKIEPVIDDDRDDIPNGTDNCVSIENSDQLNSDDDAQGDFCDDDDDDDGLTDGVEKDMGTNSAIRDSDGDGVSDKDDAFPLDSEKQDLEDEVEQPVVVKQEQEQTLREIISDVARNIQKSKEETVKTVQDVEAVDVKKTDEDFEDSEIVFSPNVVFSYERKSWNTFTFSALGVVGDTIVYTWDFGDGARSSKPTIEHAYTSSGVYVVTLTSRSGEGEPLAESTTVFVPFFTLNNPIVTTAVAILTLLLFAGAVAIAATFKKRPSRARGKVTVREE